MIYVPGFASFLAFTACTSSAKPSATPTSRAWMR